MPQKVTTVSNCTVCADSPVVMPGSEQLLSTTEIFLGLFGHTITSMYLPLPSNGQDLVARPPRFFGVKWHPCIVSDVAFALEGVHDHYTDVVAGFKLSFLGGRQVQRKITAVTVPDKHSNAQEDAAFCPDQRVSRIFADGVHRHLIKIS